MRGQKHLNFEVGTPRRGVRGRPGGPSLPVNSKIEALVFNGLRGFGCASSGVNGDLRAQTLPCPQTSD
jgi:hypothetical protein